MWTNINDVTNTAPFLQTYKLKFNDNTEEILVSISEYNKLWHENMASEAATDMLVEYLHNVIDKDLFNAYQWYQRGSL